MYSVISRTLRSIARLLGEPSECLFNEPEQLRLWESLHSVKLLSKTVSFQGFQQNRWSRFAGATVALAAPRCLKRQAHAVFQSLPASPPNLPQTRSRRFQRNCSNHPLTYQQRASHERICFSLSREFTSTLFADAATSEYESHLRVACRPGATVVADRLEDLSTGVRTRAGRPLQRDYSGGRNSVDDS